jgi:Trk-type K+ transport system membrane component
MTTQRRLTFPAWLKETFETFASRSPSRFALIVFACLIALFTVLLSQPFASASGEATNFADALFSAVSAICVAGLSSVDMATYWSPLGNAIVFTGTQVGALGVLTLASILGTIISGRLGLRARLMAASDTNPLRLHNGPVAEGQAIRLGEVGGLLATVALSLIIIETTIAVLMFPSVLAAGYPLGESIWYSFYYSAMAFTNTGFTPNMGGLEVFASDYWFLTLIMFGVFLGSVGFPVLYALSRNFKNPRKWSLHVKLSLTTWAILWVCGICAYLLLEPQNSTVFVGMSPGELTYQATFLSTMARSGGFNLVDIGQLDSSTLLMTDMLMFIGGGSASTAGGIKVTTFAVLVLAALAEARGRNSIEAFGRRIPGDVLRLAVSVGLWGATTVAIGSLIVSEFTEAPFEYVLFDVISAFATVGMSTGLTASLPDEGLYVMAAVMFMGRVGTVTLAAALAASQVGQFFRRPEERPIVG